MRVRLKSEREGIELYSTPKCSLFDRGCAHNTITYDHIYCSQNNRSYGRNRIDGLLEANLNVNYLSLPNGAPTTTIGNATLTYIHAWPLKGAIMIFFQNIPNIELTAINTTDVGVAVFSVTRNNSVRLSLIHI